MSLLAVVAVCSILPEKPQSRPGDLGGRKCIFVDDELYESIMEETIPRRFPMNPLKETAIESIKRLPDGCTVEDIMYRIDLIAQVYEGLRDADAGKLMTTEELLERIDQWAR